MANTLVNLARQSSTTTGTGTLTLGPVVQGFNTFADAGLTDGQTITYAIEDYSSDTPAQVVGREIGQGVYSAGTVTRTTVYSSTNGGAKINCTGRQHVFVTVAKEDIDSLGGGGLSDGDYGDIVVSGSGTVLSIDSGVATTFGRSLMDDADASAGRTTLGLGTMATETASDYLTTAAAAGAYQPLDAQLTDIAGLTPADSGVIVGNGSNFVLETGATLRTSLGVREKLTANRTYYVRTDGSDSNTGLADNAGGAFLTIQAAVNAFYALDVGGYQVTIQVRDGTYTANTTLFGQPPGGTAGNPLVIQGNTSTPANCIISTTSADCFTISSGAEAYIQGFKFQTTTSGTGLGVTDHARIICVSCDFGACATYHMEAKNGAQIVTAGNYTISGGAVAHQHCTSNGYILYTGGTITLTGTPAFSSYFVGVNNAYVQYASTTTFSGSATGIRHFVHNNSSVYVNGSYNASFFPGNTAGVLRGASCIDNYVGDVALANAGLQIFDTDASHKLTISPGSNLTADRVLTVTTGDAARTLDISAGSVTISTAGANLIDDADASAQRTTLGLGTAAVQNTGTSGANVPLLNASNTWSAQQIIDISPSTSASLLINLSDNGAGGGPYCTLRRTSTSPAASDALGIFNFQGTDSAGTVSTIYGQLTCLIVDPTDGSEDGAFQINTVKAGTISGTMVAALGVYVGAPTGTDKGYGTLNASTLYEDGASLSSKYQGLDSELTAIAGLTSAADRLPYFTGSGTASLATFTTAGRDLLDDADASAQRTTLGLGTAATQNTGTSGANIPLMNGGNTWSAAQIVSLSGSFASPMQLISTNADANEGPYLLFDRQSASPANNDRIGAFLWKCNDSAAANQTVGEIGFFMPTITAGSLASLMVFKTRVSGAYAERFYMKGAFYANGSSDTGAGTLNAVTLYEGGTSLASKYGALAGTTAFTAAQTIRIDNAATNSVTVAQTLSHTTTGTPAAGIGVALNFEAETAAGNNEIGAQIAAVTTDVTSTSEDFDLVFSAMAAGAAVTERGRITSKGTYKHQSFTVAGLPAGTAGETCFASNGRKNGEGAGLGTGVLVFHDGTNWCACDTGAAVAA